MDPEKGKTRNLIVTLPDAFAYLRAVTDSDGKPVDFICLQINPAFEKMTGLTEEMVIGKKVTELDFEIEKMSNDWFVIYDQLLQSGKPINFERYFEYSGGWFDITVYIDNPGHVAVIFRDITERKRTEEALRESETYIKAVMDNLPIGVAVNTVEPEVVFTYMNDNFPKFYHTTREELCDPGAFWDVVYEDPQFRKELKKRVLDDCASGNPEKMLWEDIPITRDGKVVAYINASNTPIPEKNLTISTVWDVTKRKNAEDSLEANYVLLRIAGETARFGGWSVDLGSNVCTWSDQVAEIHEMPAGYSPPVTEGINFYAPEWQEKITEVFTACTENGIPYDEEMEIITARGRRIWVRTTGEAVRNESGEIIRIQGSFQDITERKQAEAELLKQNEELEWRVKERTIQLEAVIKELESFAYSVSHDMRAPLRALDVFSANLKSKYEDRLDDQGRHYLNRIHKAALYMGDLIDDLLKLSKVTRAEFEKQQVNLSKLATEILSGLQESEPHRKVEIKVLPGLSARGDVHLLRVVIENLLGNAWKFSAKEPGAQIEVGRTVIDEDEAFFVRDNGAGFDMAYADKLFIPFQRLHGAEEFPGTGIGLATVQRIINRHGGKIWAEGEVGKGATFYFTLPG